MKIRQVNENEYEKIYELVKTSFETAQVSDGNEQEFVYELRKRDGYIKELELVMEKAGDLVGHIMFTEQSVNTEAGDVKGLLIAPICVKLEERGKGYGMDLINEGFRLARERGYNAAFLIGNPDYYSRLGFKETTKFGIENETDIPNEYVLACEILPGSLENVRGSVFIA